MEVNTVPFSEIISKPSDPEIYRELIPEIDPEVPESEPLSPSTPEFPVIPPYGSSSGKASKILL